MYRYGNRQISLSDFQQPMGMRLRANNRWVKKAQSIPWDKIEAKYANLYPSGTGNVAKPLQLALGACLIQREYGYSDEEIVLQIQENPYLQYFCGYAGYDDSKPPFDPSSMVHFRKRLTPEILVEINEMVIQEAEKKDNQNDNNSSGGGNSGTMIVDATCAPSNTVNCCCPHSPYTAAPCAQALLCVSHSAHDERWTQRASYLWQ